MLHPMSTFKGFFIGDDMVGQWGYLLVYGCLGIVARVLGRSFDDDVIGAFLAKFIKETEGVALNNPHNLFVSSLQVI